MATRRMYYGYKVLCTATTRCLYCHYKVLVLALQAALYWRVANKTCWWMYRLRLVLKRPRCRCVMI